MLFLVMVHVVVLTVSFAPPDSDFETSIARKGAHGADEDNSIPFTFRLFPSLDGPDDQTAASAVTSETIDPDPPSHQSPSDHHDPTTHTPFPHWSIAARHPPLPMRLPCRWLDAVPTRCQLINEHTMQGDHLDNNRNPNGNPQTALRRCGRCDLISQGPPLLFCVLTPAPAPAPARNTQGEDLNEDNTLPLCETNSAGAAAASESDPALSSVVPPSSAASTAAPLITPTGSLASLPLLCTGPPPAASSRRAAMLFQEPVDDSIDGGGAAEKSGLCASSRLALDATAQLHAYLLQRLLRVGVPGLQVHVVGASSVEVQPRTCFHLAVTIVGARCISEMDTARPALHSLLVDFTQSSLLSAAARKPVSRIQSVSLHAGPSTLLGRLPLLLQSSMDVSQMQLAEVLVVLVGARKQSDTRSARTASGRLNSIVTRSVVTSLPWLLLWSSAANDLSFLLVPDSISSVAAAVVFATIARRPARLHALSLSAEDPLQAWADTLAPFITTSQALVHQPLSDVAQPSAHTHVPPTVATVILPHHFASVAARLATMLPAQSLTLDPADPLPRTADPVGGQVRDRDTLQAGDTAADSAVAKGPGGPRNDISGEEDPNRGLAAFYRAAAAAAASTDAELAVIAENRLQLALDAANQSMLALSCLRSLVSSKKVLALTRPQSLLRAFYVQANPVVTHILKAMEENRRVEWGLPVIAGSDSTLSSRHDDSPDSPDSPSKHDVQQIVLSKGAHCGALHWMQTTPVCMPTRWLEASVASRVLCHHFSPTQSTACLAENLHFDPALITVSHGGENPQTVIGRRESDELPQFTYGAFQASCERLPQGPLAQLMQVVPLPFRNLLSSIGTEPQRACTHWEERLTVMFTRQEYANLFHTMREVFNVYHALLLAGVITLETTAESLRGQIRVVWLDGHAKGSLDELWSTLFHDVSFVSSILTGTCFRRVLFPHPGSKSVLQGCYPVCRTGGLRTVAQSFSRFVLTAYGLQHVPMQPNLVTILGRRAHFWHPRAAATNDVVSRALCNEAELVAGIQQARPDLVAQLAVPIPGYMTIREQLLQVRASRVLIAVHGASLILMLMLAPGATAIEVTGPRYWLRNNYARTAAHVGIDFSYVLVPSFAVDSFIVSPNDVVAALNRSIPSVGH